MYLTREITLRVAKIVITEQLQHSVPQKHGFRYIIVITLHTGDNKDINDDDDDGGGGGGGRRDDDNNNNNSNQT